jgi:hypothetical protein
MKKLVIAAGVLIGIGVVAKRLGAKIQNMDWEQAFAAMPDTAPPKWMFRNITAIRENTERVIELLEGSATPAGSEARPVEGGAT